MFWILYEQSLLEFELCAFAKLDANNIPTNSANKIFILFIFSFLFQK